MEYILVSIGCFILGAYYNSGNKNRLDSQIMSNLKLGKRVIVAIDNDATLFEMNGNRIKITKAVVDFNFEDPGVENESNNLDNIGPVESGNYNEAGLGD